MTAIKGLSPRALHGNGHWVLIALSERAVLLSSSCLLKLESSLRDHMRPKALGRGGVKGFFSFCKQRSAVANLGTVPVCGSATVYL
jgi:hypothetical protein